MDLKTALWGLLIPFIGTAAGAACVFFLKKDLKANVQRGLTGFAAGVMVAASIWSLIVPAPAGPHHPASAQKHRPGRPGRRAESQAGLDDHDGAGCDASQHPGRRDHFHAAFYGRKKQINVVPAMPYLLPFAAGAMLYVVVEELIPEMSSGEHSNIGVIFFAVGFSLMMALDVALG